jgi:sulfate transporter 4
LFFLTVVIISYFSVLYRLGWLIRFISHSVISGFTTASAIVIGLSQIKYFLGYSITRSSKIIPLIESIIAGIDQVGFSIILFMTLLVSLLVLPISSIFLVPNFLLHLALHP